MDLIKIRKEIKRKDNYLSSLGLEVLRIDDLEVKQDISSVIEELHYLVHKQG